MKSIAFVRIDDRLIHGQVITSWIRVTKANKFLIVDDLVVSDPFISKVLKMAAPPGIDVEVYSIDDAVKYLLEDDIGNEKLLILVKGPRTIMGLIKGGVKINEVNLGGMGAGPGRKKLYKNISTTEEERGLFKEILDAGINVFIRIVPDDKLINLRDFI